MSTRALTIGIAIIILAGLAYYIGTNRSGTTDPMAAATTTEQSAPQQDPKAAETESQIVGTWKSDDDAKYTRTFRADGTVTDMVEGNASATASGTWAVFTASMELPAGVAFDLDADDAYIQVVMNGEKYHYRVSALTSSRLEVVYMDRGGMLRFTKVN